MCITELDVFTGWVQPIGIVLFLDVKVTAYVPAPVNVTVAVLPVPLAGLAPEEGVTVHVINPGIPPVAVNVTDCPTLEV